jgi:transposase
MICDELEARIRLLLTAENWPVNTVAAQLGVHHTVVERVRDRAGLPRPARPPRPSLVDPFVPFITQTLEKYPRLCASRLYQMVRERGYTGSPDHFRHMVARHRPRRPAEAYLRLRTLPGEQAQVDWGHFGKVRVGLGERALMAFVMVLSYSRMLFLRFFLDARMPSFLRGHQAAFAAFGGCPRVALYDNLKSAVLERRGDAIRFHPTLLAFAGHYRYEPRPVAPARGNEKGRVERAIRYARTAFFAARKWRDLDDLNQQADAFCTGQAAQRRCPEDPTLTVGQAFELERPTLLPLPPNPFDTDERVPVDVGKTPYIRFDGNDYSVPHTAVRKTLVVVASPEQVRVLEGNEVIASHPRSYDRRQQIEDPRHVEELVAEKRKARRHRGLDRLQHAAPSSGALLAAIAERGSNLGGSTARLLRLLDQHGARELEAAIAEALAHGTPHLAAVHQVLDRRRFASGQPPPVPVVLPDDPRIKNLVVKPHALGTYDALNTKGGDDTDNDDNANPQTEGPDEGQDPKAA